MPKQTGPKIESHSATATMLRTIHCPSCSVELTIPEEAGSRRLKCPKCATRFVPTPLSPGETRSPASSIFAEPPNVPRPSPRAKVPPSSGLHNISGTRNDTPLPKPDGDLRDLLEIPLLGDDEPSAPKSKKPVVSDAEALFRDDPPPRAKRAPAETRRESRRCPECKDLVLGGMSLCESCGLDLDTGLHHEVDVSDDNDDLVMTMPAADGPPVMVLVVGVICLLASAALGLISMLAFEGIGRICLALLCLFGVFASIEFLRGRNAKPLIVALLLGGAVNIVTMIILPIVVADASVATTPLAVDDTPVASVPTEETDVSTEAETDHIKAPVGHLVERIDTGKIILGTVLLFADAILLVCLSMPSVKRHFDRSGPVEDTGALIV